MANPADYQGSSRGNSSFKIDSPIQGIYISRWRVRQAGNLMTPPVTANRASMPAVIV